MSDLKKFPITIPIPAENEEEAKQKANGLFALSQILTGEHLAETVKFIKEKPKIGQLLSEKPLQPKKIIEYLGFWDMIKDMLNPFKKSNPS